MRRRRWRIASETAPQLECDENKEQFEEKLKRIAAVTQTASPKADEK
jgi:hypothetical protein